MNYYLFILLIVLFGCDFNNKNSKVFSKDTQTVNINSNCEKVLSFIPKTSEEYLEFYSLTNFKKSKNEFFTKYELIKKFAYFDSCNILINFLQMSRFIDGEFAETYYVDADYIIENNKLKFCDLYKNNSLLAEKFKDKYLEICK